MKMGWTYPLWYLQIFLLIDFLIAISKIGAH